MKKNKSYIIVILIISFAIISVLWSNNYLQSVIINFVYNIENQIEYSKIPQKYKNIYQNKDNFQNYLRTIYKTDIVVDEMYVHDKQTAHPVVEYVGYFTDFPEQKFILSEQCNQLQIENNLNYSKSPNFESTVAYYPIALHESFVLSEKLSNDFLKYFDDYNSIIYVYPVYTSNFDTWFPETKFDVKLDVYIALEDCDMQSEKFKNDYEKFLEFIEFDKFKNSDKRIIEYVIYSVDDLKEIKSIYELRLRTFENSQESDNPFHGKYNLKDIEYKGFEYNSYKSTNNRQMY